MPPQTTASERKDIRAAEKAAREREIARGDVMRSICSTPAGREWLWHRLESCAVFQTVYNDLPSRMGLNEGRRQVGLELLADIMYWCPDQFILAMREANERRNLDDAARAAAIAERSGEPDTGRPDQGRVSDDDPTGLDYGANDEFYRTFEGSAAS